MKFKQIDFEACHDCEKSHGKIVCIEVDVFGNTLCGYCHEKVNYNKYKNATKDN